MLYAVLGNLESIIQHIISVKHQGAYDAMLSSYRQNRCQKYFPSDQPGIFKIIGLLKTTCLK